MQVMYIKFVRVGSDGIHSPQQTHQAWYAPQLQADSGTWKPGAWADEIMEDIRICGRGYNACSVEGEFPNAGSFVQWFNGYGGTVRPYQVAVDLANMDTTSSAKHASGQMCLLRPLKWSQQDAILFLADGIEKATALRPSFTLNGADGKEQSDAAEVRLVLQGVNALRAFVLQPGEATLRALIPLIAKLNSLVRGYRSMEAPDALRTLVTTIMEAREVTSGVMQSAYSNLIEAMLSAGTKDEFQAFMNERLAFYLTQAVTPETVQASIQQTTETISALAAPQTA